MLLGSAAAGEKTRTTQAISATKVQVVVYGGRIATTYYFSTSGGRTASAADVFGFDVPYLVSRSDPWDKWSPHHRWGPILLGARALQGRLGLSDRVLDAVGVPTPSGRLRSVQVITTRGATALPASALRTSLGLRSTWVTIGVLRLDQPRGTAVFGTNVRLTGVARGVASPSLSMSATGNVWSTVGGLRRDASGAVATAVIPARTLRYRIEAEGASSSVVLVRVASRVRLVGPTPAEPGTLRGTVRPRIAGARVTLERREGAGWSAIAEAAVDRNGAFRVQLGALRGSYRARVAATEGFTENVSDVVTVSL
jgi:SpoIID/LytB domain protein